MDSVSHDSVIKGKGHFDLQMCWKQSSISAYIFMAHKLLKTRLLESRAEAEELKTNKMHENYHWLC